jgi:translation initiation factor 6 (eIF-6)
LEFLTLSFLIKNFILIDSKIRIHLKLNNKFCIAPNSISKKTLFKLKSELGENFPIIKSNVLDSKCQGRLIACNSKGILLPSGTTSSEI